MAIYNISPVLMRKLWTPTVGQFLLVIVVIKTLFNIAMSLKIPWRLIRLTLGMDDPNVNKKLVIVVIKTLFNISTSLKILWRLIWLTLGMDDPNVNKKFASVLISEIEEEADSKVFEYWYLLTSRKSHFIMKRVEKA